MKRISLTLAALLLVCPAAAIRADETRAVELKTVAETEIEVLNHEGRPELRRIEAATVVPGDEVIYTIHYSNAGAETAESVVITNPIPDHMTYMAGSTSGNGTIVTYSVDGGEVFAPPEELRMPDGDGGERAASASEYTHIRWTLGATLAPDQRGSVEFRARLD
ncbi:MAG: hypothetical protein ABIK85_03525 [Candidatus Eisenbacteria bacterium]